VNTKVNQPKSPERTRKILISGILTITLLFFLAPVLLVIINSLKNEAEFYARGPLSWPLKPTFDIIQQAWVKTEFSTKLVNSLIISLSVTALGLIISVFNAFAIGIGRIKWEKLFLIFFIFAMTVPQEALAYPLYYLMKSIGLYDSKLAVIIILSVLQAAYGTYLLSTVFRTFPMALLEAAKLDGCNKWQILRMVVTINIPAISVLLVFFFIWTWNEFFLPLIFLVSNSNQTVPIAVMLFQGQYTGDATMQSACALLGILPCIIFYLIFQRTLTRGVISGGVKG
jgi:raffinose/stachyose/melibiose transport system permease protein